MTTMNSDSESQDSDEGRRFRFEATRKDSLVSLHSRKRRSSPVRTEPRRRSRSIDRGNNRDRRNDDRTRHDYRKNSRSSSDANKNFRDGDSKHLKETETFRSAFRHKDSRNAPNSSSNHKESKLSRESPFKNPRKDSKTRERDRRRSGDRSTDRTFDNKQLDKYTNKFSVRNKRNSRERSRERSYQSSKHKNLSDFEKSREQSNKTETIRKTQKKDKEIKSIKKIEKNVKETIINSESDANSRASSPSLKTECKDPNLSDFDIVSDIEEYSPDDSSSWSGSKKPRADDSLNDDDTRIKKRVSKQQYERLLKRQAVKNRRSLEELHKVKSKNGQNSPGTSNNNRTTISDPLLSIAEATTTVTNLLTDDDSNVIRKEMSESCNSDKEAERSDSDNSLSTFSTYGPTLPPKIDNTSEHRDGNNEKDVPQLTEKDKIPPRVIGPTLPAHLRQIISGEADADDTFGPALPPHLEEHRVSGEVDEDESSGLPTLADNLSEKEDVEEKNRAESEADDDDFMGPLPSDHPDLENDVVQRQLELRARRLKAELAACDIEDEQKREEWMIELPLPSTVNLGLGPRKFRVRPAPDMSDRSSWTDTPADKARKRMERLENRNVGPEPAASQERDADTASSETEKSRKRQKSLLELHQKKLTKKKKKEEKELKKMGKTVERRPFDRDVDLQANRFDEARKKSMFMKSRELDDRFSRGKI